MNRFSNTVKTEWIEGDGHKMRLIESVTFTDDAGERWFAYAGDVIDGASVPRFFWRFIGSPFVGHYRRASVIHDVYCERKNRPRDAVNRMFFEAMIADGVPKLRAEIMYKAVSIGAGRW